MFLHYTISYRALISIVLKYRMSVCLCLSVCLSGCMSACLFACLSASVCQSVCLSASVCQSVCLSASVCLSVCLFVCLSVCLFICLCLSVYLFVCLPVCLSEDGLLLFHSSLQKVSTHLEVGSPPSLPLSFPFSMTRCTSTSASKEYKTDVVHDDW